MFYDAIENRHGLPHDPLKALLAPRPIGWISTVSNAGVCNSSMVRAVRRLTFS